MNVSGFSGSCSYFSAVLVTFYRLAGDDVSVGDWVLLQATETLLASVQCRFTGVG